MKYRDNQTAIKAQIQKTKSQNIQIPKRVKRDIVPNILISVKNTHKESDTRDKENKQRYSVYKHPVPISNAMCCCCDQVHLFLNGLL